MVRHPTRARACRVRTPRPCVGPWSRAPTEAELTRIRPVEVPMPACRGQPGAVLPRNQGIAADHPLPALMVAVEQLDGQPGSRLDRLACHRELVRGRIAED